MFYRTRQLFKLINTLRKSDCLGDAAALKLTLLGKSEEENKFTSEVRKLKSLTFNEIDLNELKNLPKDSLGYSYFEFLKRNKLKPLNFSEQSTEIFDRFPISMRYVRIHDLFHVLLGFDPSLSGEIGVYAFIEEQSYSSILNKAANTSKFFSKLLFWRLKSSAEARKRGVDLAKQSVPFIAIPFEKHFDTPLSELRGAWIKYKES